MDDGRNPTLRDETVLPGRKRGEIIAHFLRNFRQSNAEKPAVRRAFRPRFCGRFYALRAR